MTVLSPEDGTGMRGLFAVMAQDSCGGSRKRETASQRRLNAGLPEQHGTLRYRVWARDRR